MDNSYFWVQLLLDITAFNLSPPPISSACLRNWPFSCMNAWTRNAWNDFHAWYVKSMKKYFCMNWRKIISPARFCEMTDIASQPKWSSNHLMREIEKKTVWSGIPRWPPIKKFNFAISGVKNLYIKTPFPKICESLTQKGLPDIYWWILEISRNNVTQINADTSQSRGPYFGTDIELSVTHK